MNAGTLITLLAVISVVAVIVVSMVKDKKSGSSICGGDCSSCHGCTQADK